MSFLDAMLFGVRLIQEEGASLPAAPTLNFTGSAVTASYDSLNNRINVAVTGGTSGWNDVAGVVQLLTSSDVVVLGATATLLGEKLRVEMAAVANTIQIGTLVSNLTAATGGTPIQRSPAQAVLGSVWDGAASQYVAWGFEA